MRKPLEGLFVVEMTSYWSATTTARFLRDMGARVVRVETPPIGDFCRYYGRSMGMPITAEENPIHDIFNGGKECVALDLKDPKNLKLMQNMLAKADVFLTSMRLGGLKKHNLDYDTLKEKYPRLVMAHATGYGCKDGPLSAAPGLDAVAFFAMNGLISDLRLNPDDSPICPPTGRIAPVCRKTFFDMLRAAGAAGGPAVFNAAHSEQDASGVISDSAPVQHPALSMSFR